MCKVWLSKLQGLAGLWTWLMAITSFIKLIGTPVPHLHPSPHLVSIFPSHYHNIVEQPGYSRHTRKSCWFARRGSMGNFTNFGLTLIIFFLIKGRANDVLWGEEAAPQSRTVQGLKSNSLCSHPTWSHYQNYLHNWLNFANSLVPQ